MSTDSRFDRDFLERYLVMFDLGELTDIRPLPRTSDLSTCRLALERSGKRTWYLLSLFDALSLDQVPFQIRLMTHLNKSALPVPAPCATLDGMTMTIFSGAPALLCAQKGEATIDQPNPAQCQALGETLGALHRLASTSGLTPAEPQDSDRLSARLREAGSGLAEPDRTLIAGAIEQASAALEAAPETAAKGIVHGNPVRANVRFSGDAIAAVQGFHRANVDRLMYDVALALVDWCTEEGGKIDRTLSAALLNGYGAERTATAGDRSSWPHLCALAAVELWLDALSDRGPLEPAGNSRCQARLLDLIESPVALV